MIQFFAAADQIIRASASASALPMNIYVVPYIECGNLLVHYPLMKKTVLGSLPFRVSYLSVNDDSLTFDKRNCLWQSTEHSVGLPNNVATVPDIAVT